MSRRGVFAQKRAEIFPCKFFHWEEGDHSYEKMRTPTAPA